MSRQPTPDPNLLCVATEIKRLKEVINECEWNRTPCSHYYFELNSLLKLQEQGTLFVPNF